MGVTSPECRKRWNDKNKDYYRRKRKEYSARDKRIAIDGYGGQCVNCGITDHDLLCFDHVNNDGAERRERCTYERTGGAALAAKLIKLGFPRDFQLLCFNCNHLKKLGRI